jgi:anti-anti-sigma factor
MHNTTGSESGNVFVIEKTNDIFQKSIIEKKINEFIKTVEDELILDLGELTTLDSSTLAAFIRFKRKLTETGRSMKLINYNENILRVIELSGLEEFLL